MTGSGYRPLNDAVRGDMVTVFIPSSPTSFSGYVVVAHREAIVDLPLTVEEALRMLISGGVIVPDPAMVEAHRGLAPLDPAARQAAIAALPPGWTIREGQPGGKAPAAADVLAGGAAAASVTLGSEDRRDRR